MGDKGEQKNKWCQSSHHQDSHPKSLGTTSIPEKMPPSFTAEHYVVEYGQFLLPVWSPICLCALSLLTGHGEQGKTVPWGWERAGQQELKHWCVINTLWVSQPSCSTTEAARKKINPIPTCTLLKICIRFTQVRPNWVADLGYCCL